MCWVGSGWVSQLMGWVGLGHTKWTHGQLWVKNKANSTQDSGPVDVIPAAGLNKWDGTEHQPLMYRCAVKKLLTHAHV